MHYVDIFGAVNTQGFVSKFLCAISTFSFIHSLHCHIHRAAPCTHILYVVGVCSKIP